MSDLAPRVIAVQEDLVTIEIPDVTGASLIKNELVYICPRPTEGAAPSRLKAEVLSIRGRIGVAQVFENTQGVGPGDPIEQTGRLLSVTLGPGLLGTVYDGLQNPLELFASDFGLFLPRGQESSPLSKQTHWTFQPNVRIGDRVKAGQSLGSVMEGTFEHKIMVRFDLPGEATVSWIQQGPATIDVPVARLSRRGADDESVMLAQAWPVRRSIPSTLLKTGQSERLYPEAPLITTQRIVDTLFPIAKGGTACIPGPFGAGKTVLQNLISRYSNVDIVVIVACGERAGEVVETITEFPQLKDPQGGGSLMDRTIIVCNTSSMPVAAREASMYTGITLSEYYRQMGYDVLMIADSTSRWAQAIRETSGRMEEIPGEEAFPAYLDSAIRSLYERAGLIRGADGQIGSLTIIGTVSPAGGNFEEPVTQSTLSSVKAFLGLSADRAYKRYYPAIDPLTSWSRYPAQLSEWYSTQLDDRWQERVRRLHSLLKLGQQIEQMMQVTGEEGITLVEYVVYQKSLLVDLVYLQQDAYDDVDVSSPLERQRFTLELIAGLVDREYLLADKESARQFFTRLISLLKNLNYAAWQSPGFLSYLAQIREHLGDPLPGDTGDDSAQAKVTSAER
jgi:V/A-type H+-transporting ATPase subunit A